MCSVIWKAKKKVVLLPNGKSCAIIYTEWIRLSFLRGCFFRVRAWSKMLLNQSSKIEGQFLRQSWEPVKGTRQVPKEYILQCWKNEWLYFAWVITIHGWAGRGGLHHFGIIPFSFPTVFFFLSWVAKAIYFMGQISPPEMDWGCDGSK